MAWCLVNGFKDIENRKRLTHIRGFVAIHAGLYVPYDGDCEEVEAKHGITIPREYELGRIVGFVNIVDCVTSHPSRWFTGPFGYVCRSAVAWDGPAITGRLGFFRTRLDVPADILARLELPQDGNQRPPVNVSVVLEPELL